MTRKPEANLKTSPLKRGWTTGACATAAAAAAYDALLSGYFADDITIELPREKIVNFKIIDCKLANHHASCAVIKDAGDDPDITHGAKICVMVKKLKSGNGVIFKAGEGVGIVTKQGLMLDVGEPAINPKPRQMIISNMANIAKKHQCELDVEIIIGVENGELLAKDTWNGRLGIIGGLSILGTTGVVIPYSCSAWIASIHRGIDVARANNITHVAAATGKTSEDIVQKKFNLENSALIDMGDFAGGMLKYLRKNPLPRLTICGGFAKMVKLSQGNLDLHSSRSQVDFKKISEIVKKLGGNNQQIIDVINANTAKYILDICNDLNLPIAGIIAKQARECALATLSGDVIIDVMIIDRDGKIIANTANV